MDRRADLLNKLRTGNAAQGGAVRGMKVRSSVKKLCDGCKVRRCQLYGETSECGDQEIGLEGEMNLRFGG